MVGIDRELSVLLYEFIVTIVCTYEEESAVIVENSVVGIMEGSMAVDVIAVDVIAIDVIAVDVIAVNVIAVDVVAGRSTVI